MLQEEFRKKEVLKLTVLVPQAHVYHYQTHVNELKRENEELEQYRRRLCIRVNGIPSVMSYTQEAECDILVVLMVKLTELARVMFIKTQKNYVKVS